MGRAVSLRASEDAVVATEPATPFGRSRRAGGEILVGSDLEDRLLPSGPEAGRGVPRPVRRKNPRT